MNNFPHPDVLLGSIVSLGAANNQQRDIIHYIQHLKPKVYYPGHLTDVAQAGSALYHKLSWRDTAYSMGFPQSEWPEFPHGVLTASRPRRAEVPCPPAGGRA